MLKSEKNIKFDEDIYYVNWCDASKINIKKL